MPLAAGPFPAVNCTALPAEPMESEAFGHERGAFTGAFARHEGFAEWAGDGTLLLDEIGDLPLLLQPKLLRLLEERRFSRVGGKAPLAFRARAVCAANADLQARVGAGRFRDDLFYRINVIAIAIPPLRERPDDVAWLLATFLKEFGECYATGPAVPAELALAHDWSGNVRELRNGWSVRWPHSGRWPSRWRWTMPTKWPDTATFLRPAGSCHARLSSLRSRPDRCEQDGPRRQSPTPGMGRGLASGDAVAGAKPPLLAMPVRFGLSIVSVSTKALDAGSTAAASLGANVTPVPVKGAMVPCFVSGCVAGFAARMRRFGRNDGGPDECGVTGLVLVAASSSITNVGLHRTNLAYGRAATSDPPPARPPTVAVVMPGSLLSSREPLYSWALALARIAHALT